MEQIVVKKLFIWAVLSINVLFAYIIGLSIPQLETRNSYIFGLIMIPLLIIFNYIVIDRFYYYIKKLDDKEEKVHAKD